MTKGGAKMLETEAIIYPMTFGQNKQEAVSMEAKSESVIVEEKSVKIDIKNRFARLKKSLRKRSVSIL